MPSGIASFFQGRGRGRGRGGSVRPRVETADAQQTMPLLEGVKSSEFSGLFRQRLDSAIRNRSPEPLEQRIGSDPTGARHPPMPMHSELDEGTRKLCDQITKLMRRRLGDCDPNTFRIPLEEAGDATQRPLGLAHHGQITFPQQTTNMRKRAHLEQQARFLHLHHEGFELPKRGCDGARGAEGVEGSNGAVSTRWSEVKGGDHHDQQDLKSKPIGQHSAGKLLTYDNVKDVRQKLSMPAYAARTVDMMELHWKMPKPSVVITIAGGAADFKLSTRLYKDLYHVTKAAEAAGAWVVTGGTDSGVMRILGRMASAVSVESGAARQSCWIGIVPWGGVRHREKIVAAGERKRKELRGRHEGEPRKSWAERWKPVWEELKGRHERNPRKSGAERVPARPEHMAAHAGAKNGKAHDEEAEKEADATEIQVKLEDACIDGACDAPDDADLEPNHTHFLLIDNTTRGQASWGSEIALRFAIEKQYCESRGVPRVMLVVQGGPGTLRSVHAAVNDHCPIVLISDSGGVSSLLSHFVETYHDERSEYYGYGNIPQAFRRKYETKVYRKMLTDIALAHHLVQPFKSGSENLEKRLLEPYLGGDRNPAALIPLKQGQKLRLAVEWNQIDVAEEIIISGKYTERDRWVAIQAAVRDRNTNLVRLLAEQIGGSGGYEGSKSTSGWGLGPGKGFDYVSLYHGHAIYFEKCFHSQPVRDALEKLREFETKRRRKMADKVLEQTSAKTFLKYVFPFMERVLKKAGGQETAYLKDRLEKRLKFLEEHEQEFERKQEDAVKRGDRKPPELPRGLSTHVDLLLWAVFVADIDFSEALWAQCASEPYGDPIRLALMAAQLSSACALACRPDTKEQERYQKNAEKFEQWACDVLRMCAHDDDAELVLLRLDLSGEWSGTVLRMALEGSNKLFIGADYVQRLVGKAWDGRLDPEKPEEEFELTHEDPDEVSASASTWLAISWLRINCNGRRERIAWYKIPMNKFRLRALSYAIFLVLYGLSLSQVDNLERLTFSWPELLLYVWGLGLLFEEADQYQRDHRRGLYHFQSTKSTTSLWNYLDLIMLLALALSFVLRMLAFSGFEPSCAALDADFEQPPSSRRLRAAGNDAPAVDDEDNWWAGTALVQDTCSLLWWAWFVVSICAPLSFMRFVDYLAREFKKVGVLMQSLTGILVDVAAFCGVFLTVVAGFYMFTVGMMPSQASTDGHTAQLSLKLASWAMLGEYFGVTDTVVPWHQTAVTWLYAVFTQVLLINLLIAMMNDTYASAKAEGNRQHTLDLALTTSEAAAAGLFFPPFNIVSFPILTVLRCVNSLKELPCMQDPIDLHDCHLRSEYVRLIQQPDMLLQMRMQGLKPREMRVTVAPSEEDVQHQQLEILQRVTTIGTNAENDTSLQTQRMRSISKRTAKVEKELHDLMAYLVAKDRPVHVKARTGKPSLYLTSRVEVKEQFCDWDKPLKTYRPKECVVNFDQKETELRNKTGDPEDATKVDWKKRQSLEGVLRFDDGGRPLNPRGRTGLRGRGSFYVWGPNLCLDPIVTRYDPSSPKQLQVLCKWRPQDQLWGLPGTIMRKSATPAPGVPQASRSKGEAVGVFESNDEAIARCLKDMIDPLKENKDGAQQLARLFHQNKVIYQGYVDDPRNTDNSWAETTVLHYHCNLDLGRMLEMLKNGAKATEERNRRATMSNRVSIPQSETGDAPTGLHWIDVDISDPLYQTLFANHRELIQLAAQLHGYKGNERTLITPLESALNVTYVTDIEGNWSYFLKWVEMSRGLTMTGFRPDGSADLVLDPEWRVVFGGDVCDKGPEGGVGGSVRVSQSLLALKLKYPDRVVLLLGNRDLNKLRFASELDDKFGCFGPTATAAQLRTLPGPYWLPRAKSVTPAQYLRRLVAKQCSIAEADVSDEQLLEANTKANRVRYILKETMGADGEFERRRLELQAVDRFALATPSLNGLSEEERVVVSFTDSVRSEARADGPGMSNFMYEFIRHGQLAARIGDTLYVHGGIMNYDGSGEETSVLGVVPDQKQPIEDIDEWITSLNEWKDAQLKDYRQKPHGTPASDRTSATRGGDALMDYGVPTTRTPSVVMGRHLDASSMAKQLPANVVDQLKRDGINRILVGHTPHGNCPTVVTNYGSVGTIDLIMADTSYSDMSATDNRGSALSTITVHADGTTTVDGDLHDGNKVEYTLSEGGGGKGDRYVGRLEAPTSESEEQYFVKARLRGGDYLLCHVSGFKYQYKVLTGEETERRLGDVKQDDQPDKTRPLRLSTQYSTPGEETVVGHPTAFQAARGSLVENIFKWADADKSGQVSIEELRSLGPVDELIKLVAKPVSGIDTIEKLFNAIDKDRSGTISLEELHRFLTAA